MTKSALNEEQIRVDLHSPRRLAALAVMTLIASVLVGVAGETAASARSGSAAAPRPVDPPHRIGARQRTKAAEVPRTIARNRLLKEVLSEEAEGSGAEPPGVSALCQRFIGRPNPYADPAPNVDQIVGDAIVQAGTQTGCSTAQNESTIAVNPENPRNRPRTSCAVAARWSTSCSVAPSRCAVTRREQRLPRLQQPGEPERHLRPGLHLVRWRKHLDQRSAAAPDLPDRRAGSAVLYGCCR